MFHGVCKSGRCLGPGHYVDCDLDTTDPAVLVAHMTEVHKRRQITPEPLIKRTRAGWRKPKPKAFEPGRFDVGAWVTWRDGKGEHTGQVWAVHGPRSRWVADGVEYHDVHEAQLVRADDSKERAA